MDPNLPNVPGAGPVLVQLFRGVLYRDRHEILWQNLLDFQALVREYVGIIGLELILDEAEGYAFLRQREPEEGDEDPLPRLVQRRALSYPLSLLLLLLRKRLVEQDAGGDEARVVLEQERLVEMLRVYLPDRGSEARTVDYIRTQINKAVDYGFLHRLKGDRDSYEVRRIVKAAVSADWLADIDARLAAYHEAANPDEP